ncbi:MAG: hypothetical protein JKY50_13425 [Oleispira sp.]|nr:hypothetical protein [Oleispira sp.]MBL4880410.1 hypothetical protein [Oleispira sp.]
MRFFPNSMAQLGCYSLLATSLTLTACGGSSGSSGSGDQAPPAPTTPAVTSLALSQAQLTKTLSNNTSSNLLSLAIADVKVNGTAATAEQFNNTAIVLSGDDKNLFTLTKTADKAELVFNSAATALEKSSCGGDFICEATITATLEDQTASLNATINLVFPVVSLEVAASTIEEPVTNAKRKLLITISKDQLLVNGVAALNAEFMATNFTLESDNEYLFTLTKTDSQVTLSFNSAEADIAKQACTDNVCTANLLASYKGQQATVAASIAITYPLAVRASHLLTDEGYYFLYPGTDPQSGLEGFGDSGPIFKPAEDWTNGVVRLPLLPLLMVRDEGQTSIVAGDDSINAYNATPAQREAYLEKYALSVEELQTLSAEVISYTANESMTTCQELELNHERGDTAANCHLLVRQPDNPQVKDSFGNTHEFPFGLQNKASIENASTDYFSEGGLLSQSIDHIKTSHKECSTSRFNTQGGFTEEVISTAKNTCNIADDSTAQLKDYNCMNNALNQSSQAALLDTIITERCAEDHAYESHFARYKETLNDVSQPLLVLHNAELFIQGYRWSMQNFGSLDHRYNSSLNSEGVNNNGLYPVDVRVSGAETDIILSVKLVNMGFPGFLNTKDYPAGLWAHGLNAEDVDLTRKISSAVNSTINTLVLDRQDIKQKPENHVDNDGGNEITSNFIRGTSFHVLYPPLTQ